MKSFNALAATLLVSCLFAGSASASSIIELGEESLSSVSSIITLGDADPCADNACGDEDVASADSADDSNAALVDIYGMPTNMPVIMRPSMDTPAAPATTAVADPAATPPAAPASQQPTQQPEPVVETPKMEPAPAVEQPGNEVQQQQNNGQPVER